MESVPKPVDEPAKGELFAKTKKDLAEACGVSPKSIGRWCKRPDFPQPGPDGSWEVPQVQAWIQANGLIKGNTNLRDENLKLKNEQLRWEIDRDKELYLKKTDVQRWLGEMITAFQTALFASVNRIASQVAVQDASTAAVTLRKEFKKALSKLATEPWDATKQFAEAEQHEPTD